MKKVLLLVVLSSIGCAHTTTQKVYRNMAVAGTAGITYGATQDSNKTAMALLNGALAASIAAVVTLAIENPDKEELRLRNEVEMLKSKLDEVSSPKVTYQGDAMFHSRIPSKYKELIKPGEWKIYKIDEWVSDGDNRLIHQDQIVELIPPTLEGRN
ncbi:hypothetical protein ACLVWU_08615 [Bdellovibrio sp. HCB290]|uniref:hypothetical protein n=1 Tax=Bdellovibrio sp. HCB290 TaxID=3394356 RepID=UPI0039B41D12